MKLLALYVLLSWLPVERADHYRVYVGTQKGCYARAINVGDVTSYKYPVSAATKKRGFVYMAVTAENEFGESAYSKVLKVRVK